MINANPLAFMNSTVALPIAAAVPVASPSIAGVNDTSAQTARLEQAIGLLRTRHVCDGWKMDEAGAERGLRYFRAGCPDDEDQGEYVATLNFIASHGLSLDWILGGDVGSMICQLAAGSRKAMTSIVGDDPIFAAIESHKTSFAALSEALRIHSLLESDCRCKKGRRFSRLG